VVSYFFFLSYFFLAYSQLSQIGCLPYFHTWCGLSANLECMSEMCCVLLAENTGRKTSPKIAISSSSHNFVGLYLRKGHVSTIRKIFVKQQYLLHISSQTGKLGLLAGKRLRSIGGFEAPRMPLISFS